ncbi:CHAP domain-containing protein [Marispirochaeta aestuarii]|uniref:C40 family peptidase n=1 Tax=Marispirochaeta aestuarii TaxID=1963862 RepID=UPI0029C99B69|nr:CHAP domain-containing protein [Marispirochaeta aestuarii]
MMRINSREASAFLAIGLLFLILSGCVSLSDSGQTLPPSALTGDKLTETQIRLVEGAGKVLGARRLDIGGREYPLDCTGTIMAIYAYAGIDLQSPMRRFSGNGVTRLYRYMESLDLLYSSNTPLPGDLVFWDNTYDRNNDGKWNDTLTHVGMVVAVDSDGTVHYVHHNYRKGIVLARMNLLQPDTLVQGNKQLNSAMRMRDGKVYPLWLSSHLYRELGKGWELKS